MPAIVERNSPPPPLDLHFNPCYIGDDHESTTHMAEIHKMTDTHHQMMLWLVENPGQTLRAMSDHFHYSVPWLSQVINSDIFQMRLREMQDESQAIVIADVPAKLRGIACQALDLVAEDLDKMSKAGGPSLIEREQVSKSAEMALRHLGYGQPKNPPSPAGGVNTFVQHNTYVSAPPQVIERARQKLLERNVALSEASQLPAGGEGNNRAVQLEPATVFEPAGTPWKEAPRDIV